MKTMTALTLDKASKAAGSISGLFPHYGQKSVKAIQQTLCVTTDEKNAEKAKELLKFTLEAKEMLPVEATVGDLPFIKESLNHINQTLNDVNKVLGTLQDLFSKKNATIEIDDNNMILFMNCFKEAQENLIYVSDFLTLAHDSQKSKQEIFEGKKEEYTLEELISYINAA